MSICSKCGKEKEQNEFSKGKRYCKQCAAEYSRQYRKNNAEKVRLSNALYRKRNPDKVEKWNANRREKWPIYKARYEEKAKEYRKANAEKARQRAKEWRENNPERDRENHRRYREANGGRIKEATRLWRLKNKNKILQQMKQYAEENKDFIRQYRKEWKQKNRERVRLHNLARRNRKNRCLSAFTEEEWIKCLTFFNNKCAYCGVEAPILHQDHFVALYHGGPYTKDNILPACPRCNLSKYNNDFYEWYPKQEYFDIDRQKKIEQYLKIMSEDAEADAEAIALQD